MDIADLLTAEPASLASWTHRAYDRVRGTHLTEREWRDLFEFGVTAALGRRDMDGLRSVLALAANYFDSIGDQFGCLTYIEETMQRAAADPQARAIVLECTHDLMIGNS